MYARSKWNNYWSQININARICLYTCRTSSLLSHFQAACFQSAVGLHYLCGRKHILGIYIYLNSNISLHVRVYSCHLHNSFAWIREHNIVSYTVMPWRKHKYQNNNKCLTGKHKWKLTTIEHVIRNWSRLTHPARKCWTDEYYAKNYLWNIKWINTKIQSNLATLDTVYH